MCRMCTHKIIIALTLFTVHETSSKTILMHRFLSIPIEGVICLNNMASQSVSLSVFLHYIRQTHRLGNPSICMAVIIDVWSIDSQTDRQTDTHFVRSVCPKSSQSAIVLYEATLVVLR